MKEFIKSLIMLIFRICRIDNNKIVIVNFYGKGYGDSSKYICNELLSRNKDYNIIWICKNMNDKFPNGIKKVKYNSLRSFYELSTAKIWIDNSRKQSGIIKRKGQFYLQTWHSSLRLKKIEKDAISYLPKGYIKNAILDSKKADLMICGNKFSKETIERAFWYNGKIIMTGTPKMDTYFDDQKKKNIRLKMREKYNIKDNEKVILYAPTFRNNKNITEVIDFHKLDDEFSKLKNFRCFVKLHPIDNSNILELKNIENVSSYSDIQDLVIMSDYLITDYSGCSFDSFYNKTPCLLYVPDYDDYISKEREMYFNFHELPFQMFSNIDDLINGIIVFDYNNYINKIAEFANRIGLYEDGHASERVADIIDRVINNEKI